MEKLIPIPEAVNVKLENFTLVVAGPKGELRRDFRHPRIKLELSGKEIKLSSEIENRRTSAVLGSWAAHMRNMMTGAEKGWAASLKAVYSHFPVKMNVEADRLVIQNFLGERKPRVAKIAGETKVDVKKDDITVTGPNKEHVGQTCGNIELASRVVGRDRRVVQDGVLITSKPAPIEEESK
jgi:large subunit ribosomal protein L6